MSPTSNIPKLIHVKFPGATTGDPVVITNMTTGERVTKVKTDGDLLRVEGKQKSIVFDMNNFISGVTTGDKIEVAIGGKLAGNTVITVPTASSAPQSSSVTGVAVSTGVLSI